MSKSYNLKIDGKWSITIQVGEYFRVKAEGVTGKSARVIAEDLDVDDHIWRVMEDLEVEPIYAASKIGSWVQTFGGWLIGHEYTVIDALAMGSRVMR